MSEQGCAGCVHVGSRNVFRRFRTDVMLARSVIVQPLRPEVQQLLHDVRDLLARIEEQQR